MFCVSRIIEKIRCLLRKHMHPYLRMLRAIKYDDTNNAILITWINYLHLKMRMENSHMTGL